MATIDMKTLKFANDENTYKVVDGEALHTKTDIDNAMRGSWDGTTAPTDTPNGVTYVESGATATELGYPANYVTITTVKLSTHRQYQICIAKSSGRMWVRTNVDETTWTDWQLVYNEASVFYSSTQPSNSAAVGSLWLCPAT